MTLNELYEEIGKQIANGNGDKIVLTTDDADGNGFHGLFWGVVPSSEFSTDILSRCDLHGLSVDFVREKCIIMG